ncbi:HAD-IIIA family hydrolase [Extensimonas sp. H3M7-6]|uniref:HAD-IIIA family hydrolase n=1 Tax=Extensimonas soli TaxID=3031322 RepID=UPI0023D9EF56|nr:HAD-IIIA family hydrolase [Extensimonas sp. H3M7-6]MDF1482576.1 HAD-IIIA family hydrolase [Extensimonas sp. H3M7-6]
MKLAILDRDGTLNLPGDGYITSPDEWIAQPGALEAVARLNHAGWHVVLACNQPGLGRGLFDVKVLNAIHAKMYRQLAAVGGRIDAVFFCPHAPQETCRCRLPQPELLAQICERYGVDAAQVLVVGSSMALLQAGAALGVRRLHLVQQLAQQVGAASAAAQGMGALANPVDGAPEPLPEVQKHASLGALVEHLLQAETAAEAVPLPAHPAQA